MNRRQFLALGGASVGAAAGLYSVGNAAVQSYPTIAGNAVVSLKSVKRLIAERVDPLSGRCRYVADLGHRQVENPILIAKRGDQFEGTIQNRLPQPTTVHFHGLALAENQDGAGFDPIAPGASKSLRFAVLNRAGLYWFHPHPHGFTAEQAHAGLAGMLVVTDADDMAVDSALAIAPTNRLALAVTDVTMAGESIRAYAPSATDCLHGWFGNRALVNGRIDATFPLERGWARLQILNACNARGLLLAFRDGNTDLPFHLLGTDGGLLQAPQALDRVFVHPAERLDIALQVSGHGDISAVSLAFDPRHQLNSSVFKPSHPAREQYPPLAADRICTSVEPRNAPDYLPDGAPLLLFTLGIRGAVPAAIPPLPSQLSALPPSPASSNTPDRRLRLDFSEQSGFMIDGTPYRVDDIAHTVRRGTQEVWEVKNSPISMPHPMHLHGFSFRILRRQGTFGPSRGLVNQDAGRLPTDLGAKDTVVIWPNETVWLAIDFTQPEDAAFDGRQRYLFHCHNLEHEDGMMMQNFAVL